MTRSRTCIPPSVRRSKFDVGRSTFAFPHPSTQDLACSDNSSPSASGDFVLEGSNHGSSRTGVNARAGVAFVDQPGIGDNTPPPFGASRTERRFFTAAAPAALALPPARAAAGSPAGGTAVVTGEEAAAYTACGVMRATVPRPRMDVR